MVYIAPSWKSKLDNPDLTFNPLKHTGPTILRSLENVNAFQSFRSKIQQAILVVLTDSGSEAVLAW